MRSITYKIKRFTFFTGSSIIGLWKTIEQYDEYF
uniref:Uncharacterized protein n=1 Tax=Podoviridae sp. ctiJY10 TaxID=2826572 RepID=A0A8S5N4V7_9CAUD|nr:MAG TPA: hypothetical protein [Podoviridae sp. ctiJY10]